MAPAHLGEGPSALSDTTSASSRPSPASNPSPTPLALGPLALDSFQTLDHARRRQTLDQTEADLFPELVTDLPQLPKRPLPSPRAGRSLSLAQLSAPIKRKPLSHNASPLATRFSVSTRGFPPPPARNFVDDLPRPEQRFARSCSVDSPTLYEFPDHRGLLGASSLKVVDAPASPEPDAVDETHAHTVYTELSDSDKDADDGLDKEQQELAPDDSASLRSGRSSAVLDVLDNLVQSSPVAAGAVADVGDTHLRNGTAPGPADAQTARTLTQDEDPSSDAQSVTTQGSTYGDYIFGPSDSPEPDGKRDTVINTTAMSMFSRKSPPPHLNLGPPLNPSDVQVTNAAAAPSSLDATNLNKPLPKSPASSKLGSIFGWAASPTPSSTTEFSDGRGFSPLPSPYSHKPTTAATESYESPASAKSTRFANAADEPLAYCESYLQTPSGNPDSLVQIEEMEDELKAISAELAASIRREMDLEDLVDRLQDQVNNPQAPGKRTSDYFSDSGYSSAKYSEYDHAKEEISQIQRRAEQEKAQLRLELTTKVQDERSRRRALDQQIQELSKKASQVDVARLEGGDASGRVKELENQCEDLSRRLSEERQVKDNFEDLLSALKGELRTAINERDNLRDEVVPQLRLRVEGLEAEAAENAKLAYDASKMQQELQSLRSENSDLKQAGTRMSVALSRSASVTGASSKKSKPRPLSLSRSNTVRPTEPREVLAERLKDVEAQRDALHSALKSLLERQELQNRDNLKRIKQLEMERDRLLTASPNKAGYERDVSNLREEINVLRRRAEEAMEQKWQVEKGLGGLKMDLDRAEEEIASLRSLLKEKDILIPETLARASNGHEEPSAPVTSASLEKAYRDLQDAYAQALERIKTLEEGISADEKTQLAIQRLEQSLAAALSDRDMARAEVDSYRSRLGSFEALEKEHLSAERNLAEQLHESARRVEELSQQVRLQLEANSALRVRLADTIARGEADQRASTERIAAMQDRLRALEELVVAAQTGAEERVARHEDELSSLKEAHSIQLQRLRDGSGGLRSPRLFPPKSPLSPIVMRAMSASGQRSSRMSSPLLSPYGTSRPAIRRSLTAPLDGSAGTMTEQVEMLKGRVAELEGALAAADLEMQEVVSRMNTAQIEVMSLQEQREEAVRETRRLQRVLEQERMKVFEERFRTLASPEVR